MTIEYGFIITIIQNYAFMENFIYAYLINYVELFYKLDIKRLSSQNSNDIDESNIVKESRNKLCWISVYSQSCIKLCII